jgi:hypothetical protein
MLALVAPLSVAVGLAYGLSAARRARSERAASVTEIPLVNGTSSAPRPAVAAVSTIRSAEQRRN